MEGLRVFFRHCRELKYCTAGVKLFCEQHGFNYASAIVNGISCEDLRKLNDHRAQLLIERAEAEWAEKRR